MTLCSLFSLLRIAPASPFQCFLLLRFVACVASVLQDAKHCDSQWLACLEANMTLCSIFFSPCSLHPPAPSNAFSACAFLLWLRKQIITPSIFILLLILIIVVSILLLGSYCLCCGCCFFDERRGCIALRFVCWLPSVAMAVMCTRFVGAKHCRVCCWEIKNVFPRVHASDDATHVSLQ